MLKSIGAVVAGFLLWSVLWIAYNALLRNAGILPADISQGLFELQPLLLLLAGAAVNSFASGWLASRVGRADPVRAAMALGILLMGFGVAVQMIYWLLMPVWYHIAFLVQLLPMCLAGAALRRD